MNTTCERTALSLELNVSENCNMDCLYCYLQSGKKTESNNILNEEIADKIINKYIENNVDFNYLNISFWGGEPLLNFKIIKHIINEIHKYKHKFLDIHYLIVTNGTLINYAIAKFCKKEKIELQITIDGNKECHNKQRRLKDGRGSFDIILNNIALLKKKHIHYSVKSTLTKKSPSIYMIVDEFKNKGLNNAYFGVITPITNYDYKYLSPIEANIIAKDLFKTFLQTKNEFSFGNIEKAINYFFSNVPKLSCGVCENKVAIKYDGSIYPCHRMVDSPELCIGKIQYNGMVYGKKYANILKDNENCKVCEYKHFCGGSCAFEVSQKQDTNYIQVDMCTFNKSILSQTFKMLIDKYISNKTSEHTDKPFISLIEINDLRSKNKITMNKITKSPFSNCIDLGEEGILYLEQRFDKRYIINITVLAIWDLIDGQRTPQEIAEEIATACEIPLAEIEKDIYQQLATFQELGLIEEVKETV